MDPIELLRSLNRHETCCHCGEPIELVADDLAAVINPELLEWWHVTGYFGCAVSHPEMKDPNYMAEPRRDHG